MEQYVGRFAPSPTGPLHFGSIVAALASYLDAKHHQGDWLLRIEDLDPPRESADAPEIILGQLRALGLQWNGEVLFQSSRLAAYERALEKLQQLDRAFNCSCTRKEVAAVYPGTCRMGPRNPKVPLATRFKVKDQSIQIEDRVLGIKRWSLNDEVGDFIIQRKDGLFAYQLAVVEDDKMQGISHVVRGSDLLDSTPRQIELQQALGYSTPGYMHIPVMADDAGHKLSKQAHATPLDVSDSIGVVRAALARLGQPLHWELNELEGILELAVANWNVELIPKRLSLTAPSEYQ